MIVDTAAAAREWALSWLFPDVPWVSRAATLRRLECAIVEKRRWKYPEAARELRVMLMLAELGYL